ncbi:MAG: biopolymer transporter ExbD [Candidatus Hydrogenedentes bacterium]|nr:biopolymer transporter ExbD [Candidatus Hydrogenedentota bacterium]
MKGPEKSVMDEINITPLTDIFLVLLIIMMVVAPMLHYRALQVSAISSDAESAANPDEPKVLVVAINADGHYLIGEQEVPNPDLLNRIRQEAPAHPEGVLVELNPDATLESLTFVLNAVSTAGITKVSVIEQAAASVK